MICEAFQTERGRAERCGWQMRRHPSITPACFFLCNDRGHARTGPPHLGWRVSRAARMRLVQELPGPVEEGAELIRIGHKIYNERHRGQHEDCISHGFY